MDTARGTVSPGPDIRDQLPWPQYHKPAIAQCIIKLALEDDTLCCLQGLVILLCALGPEELSEVRLGPLTPHAVRTLRHVKAFFGVTFSVKPQAASKTIFLSCIGAGVKNVSKRIS